MHNPHNRMHDTPGVGRRNTPRPAAHEDVRARVGYGIVNHIRGVVSGAPRAADTLWSPRRAPGRADLADSGYPGAPRYRIRVGSTWHFETPILGAAEDSPLLLAQVRELTAANRRKDEFLALLSHELRTPLCALGYALGLLRQHTSGPPGPLQGLIERQLLRMTQLVEEALDVSRVSNGLLTLHSERMDLRVAVSNAIETLQSDVKGRNQCLHSRLPEEGAWVMGDMRRLEQVFVNLISNASRYTDKAGELTAWMYMEGGEAIVRIRDSGIGIAADSLSGIFELFRQVNSADPRSKAGLGVGLALVRQLVELHGGKVTAASDGIGRGSEFRVRIPTLAE